MARIGSVGSPRPLLPVDDSGNGQVVIEIVGSPEEGQGTRGVTPRNPDRQAETDIQLVGEVIEAVGETPETDVHGNETVGQRLFDYIWCGTSQDGRGSSKLYSLTQAVDIEPDDDGGFDVEDLIGKQVGVRYRHQEREGEVQVNVTRYFAAP